MIQVPGSLLHDLRTIIRKGLGVHHRRRGPAIHLQAQMERLTVRVIAEEIALQWTMAGNFFPIEFSAPLDLLREYTGGRSTPVTLQIRDGQVESHWTEAGIPRSYCFRVESPQPFPAEPSSWMINDAQLLKALADAAQTSDRESSRFALSYVCLRGRDGRVAGTDGRHLFAQIGFTLPWEEDCLVPIRQLLTCPNLLAGQQVEVGKMTDWVVLRSGDWTVWLKINKGARFPEIDFLVRPTTSALANIYLTESDAQFLRRSLKHLPRSDSFYSPITVDLNGKVAVRTQVSEDAAPTELVLAESRWEGAACSLAIERRYLSRAIQLGFRRVRIAGSEDPLIFSKGDRTMVLAPLNKSAIIDPMPEAKKIESSPRTRLFPRKRQVILVNRKRISEFRIARGTSRW